MSWLPRNAASATNDNQRNSDIHGCFVSKEYAELPTKGNIDTILSYFIN
jgi:hypothetical protein